MRKHRHKNNSITSASHLSYLERKTACRFTLIELLIVIAIIAILSRSKFHFFLLFSAI